MAVLEGRYRETLGKIGIQGVPDEVVADLLGRYSEPHRKHHALENLREGIRTLDEIKFFLMRRVIPIIELAIFFHRAIYVPGNSDNEEKSAEYAEEMLRKLGCTDKNLIGRLRKLILITKPGAEPATLEEGIISDINLLILSTSSWERFERYERELREEQREVPGDVFIPARGKALLGLLNRPEIFVMPYFREANFKARTNILRILRLRYGVHFSGGDPGPKSKAVPSPSRRSIPHRVHM